MGYISKNSAFNEVIVENIQWVLQIAHGTPNSFKSVTGGNQQTLSYQSAFKHKIIHWIIYLVGRFYINANLHQNVANSNYDIMCTLKEIFDAVVAWFTV
jgi:hypothetical protein